MTAAVSGFDIPVDSTRRQSNVSLGCKISVIGRRILARSAADAAIRHLNRRHAGAAELGGATHQIVCVQLGHVANNKTATRRPLRSFRKSFETVVSPRGRGSPEGRKRDAACHAEPWPEFHDPSAAAMVVALWRIMSR